MSLPVSAVPPVLSVFQQSFNATADYQESVTFTCITSGSPDPVVTWHRYLLLILNNPAFGVRLGEGERCRGWALKHRWPSAGV